MGSIEAGIEREAMHRREITLADGRYMIFYTFGDGDLDARSDRDVPTEEGTSSSSEADAI